ncbi:hypothetical protein LZ31DRAFT_28354, partial [Colletotrichum somersetense]
DPGSANSTTHIIQLPASYLPANLPICIRHSCWIFSPLHSPPRVDCYCRRRRRRRRLCCCCCAAVVPSYPNHPHRRPFPPLCVVALALLRYLLLLRLRLLVRSFARRFGTGSSFLIELPSSSSSSSLSSSSIRPSSPTPARRYLALPCFCSCNADRPPLQCAVGPDRQGPSGKQTPPRVPPLLSPPSFFYPSCILHPSACSTSRLRLPRLQFCRTICAVPLLLGTTLQLHLAARHLRRSPIPPYTAPGMPRALPTQRLLSICLQSTSSRNLTDRKVARLEQL